METATPFTGTPWTCDDEIYDYVYHKRYVEEWDWDYIKDCLVESGLEFSYAEAIICNMQTEGYVAHENTAWKGLAKILLGLIVFFVGGWLVISNPHFHLRGRGYFLLIFGSGYLVVDGIRDLLK